MSSHVIPAACMLRMRCTARRKAGPCAARPAYFPPINLGSVIKNMASNGDVANKLEKLQYQLEGFIENLRTVGVIAGDFQQNGQNNFNEKL